MNLLMEDIKMTTHMAILTISLTVAVVVIVIMTISIWNDKDYLALWSDDLL